MHYYLCGWTGSGTSELDPFVPQVTSAQWQAIDLRGDPSKANGNCLVTVDTRPASDPASAVYLGTDLDTPLGSPTRQRLSQALGIAFDPSAENTVRSIITAMLTKYASDTDATRPKPLRADRTGRRQITLGAATWAA